MESHDIVFVVAEDVQDAKNKAKQKTKLKYDLHKDGIMEIEEVDGWKVVLEAGSNDEDKMVVEKDWEVL